MTWRFVLAEPGGGGAEIIDLTTATDRSYSRDLLEGHTASFSMYSSDPDCQMISPGAHDVKVYEDNRLRDRLRIVSAQRNGGEGSQRTFTCVSYKQMLDRKKIFASDTAATTGLAGVDLEEAAWSLINTSQARESAAGGNAYNISRSGVSTGRTITGVKYFDPGTSVREAIDDMSQTETTAGADDGWEWDIVADGDGLTFYTWSPRRGNASAETYFDNPVVADFDEDFDFSQFANYIVVQGSAGADQTYILDGNGATAGAFTLSFNGYTTPSMTYAISLATLTLWLEALPSIGSGNVEVTGVENMNKSPYTFTIKFSGRLARKALPALTMSSTLTGGTGETLSLVKTGSRYTAQVYASDYADSPYGIVEYYHFDDKLTDIASVDERAAYLLRTMGNYRPSVSMTLQQTDFTLQYDLGDYVAVQLSDIGYEIDRTDLRVMAISYDIGDDGDVGVSLTIASPQPIDRTETNLGRRVAANEAARKARERELARQKQLARQKIQKKINALTKTRKSLEGNRSKLERYYKTHGNRRIDRGREKNRITGYTRQISKIQKLITGLQKQLKNIK